MPQRWGIWFAVEGDLRFLSHHDMMRAVERTVARAALPVRYSQGFNPRPDISLVFPRPVGVATAGDLMVLALEAPIDAEDLLGRLNACSPRGLRMLRAEVLPDRSASRVRKIHYELPLDASRARDVGARIEQLRPSDAWPMERHRPAKRRGQPTKTQQIDLKGLVADIHVEGSILHMTLQPKGDLWARPGEVLKLLGLDDQADLASTVRTHMEVGA